MNWWHISVYLCKWEDTYFILQNKYLRIYEKIALEQRYLEMIATQIYRISKQYKINSTMIKK